MSYSPDPEAFAVNAFHQSWVGYFYAFLPFCLISQVRKEESEGLVIIPKWSTQSWWPMAMKMLIQAPVILPTKASTLFLPSNPSKKHPLHEKLVLIKCHLSGNSSKKRDLSPTATKILDTAWKTGTTKQYDSHLEKWRWYCGERNIDPFSPTVEEGINFLAGLFEKGLGYSGLNTARSALSSIITLSNNTNFGTHLMVCQFLEGVFENRPSLPKYNKIWDARLVLDYLKTFQTPENLTLKMLKLTMILALILAQRCQTLQALSLNNMFYTEDQFVFHFKTLLKTSRPDKHLTPLAVKAYHPDAQLCPFKLL